MRPSSFFPFLPVLPLLAACSVLGSGNEDPCKKSSAVEITEEKEPGGGLDERPRDHLGRHDDERMRDVLLRLVWKHSPDLPRRPRVRADGQRARGAERAADGQRVGTAVVLTSNETTLNQQ
jgi:hypothetical protein